jgi:sugar/nucleoside kinase (ribokinase family)
MIHVFGTICIDRVRRVPSLPAIGGYVEVQSEMALLGGEAANTATALRRWGSSIILTGNGPGHGREAALLRRLLKSKKLPLENLPFETADESETRTPVCDIYVTPDGERTMFGQGFSDMQHSVIPEAIPMQPGAWFTAEPNMGEVARSVVRRAIESGMKTYLMDFIRQDEPIAEGSFWQSSTDWAGTRNNMQRNVQWVQRWAHQNKCFTLLSDGPNGFVAGGPGHSVRAYPPYPAPVVVDTTGAGDMFRAGMLFGLDQAWPIGRCLQFASAAGCLACRSLGATTDVPRVKEILKLIEDHPQVSSHYI